MIGFDIGGTKCAVSIGEVRDGALCILDKKKIPTDLSVSPYEMIDRLCALAEEMTNDFSAIGISCGGPLDAARGVILSPPNLPGWDEVFIVPYLQKRYGGAVCMENDANACAVAEWRFGAARGAKNAVFLTFGTGLGAGLILDGKLYRGSCGNAGEVGHIRLAKGGPVGYGKAGSFEGFASGGGIAQLARAAAKKAIKGGAPLSWCKSEADLPLVNAATLAAAARAGDAVALKIWRTAAKRLGQGLSLLVDILNPEKIVIGSIYLRAEDLLRDEMLRVMKKECLAASLATASVVGAGLGESLGDYAALSLAAELKGETV